MDGMDTRTSAGGGTGGGWVLAIAVLAALCAVAAAASGFGNRFGWWNYRTGFTILRWSVYIAAGAGVVCLLAFLAGAARKSYPLITYGLAGAIIAAALVLPAWNLQRTGSRVPRIHDITTDTDNPPAFVAILPLRKGSANPPEYDGPKVAAQQKAGYADIRPVEIAVPPQQAYARALAAARAMGWDIVAEDPQQGRIEATDRTFWFGFRDDVVIRVSANGPGSRVDIRSKSRIGRSDFGTNARRVRTYIRKLSEQAG